MSLARHIASPPSPLVHQNLCQSLSSLLPGFETGDVNHQSRQLRDPPQLPLAGRPKPRLPSRQALQEAEQEAIIAGLEELGAELELTEGLRVSF